MSGFDFNQPVYLQQLEEGQELFQYIRNASSHNLSPNSGNWFTLAGATTAGVAIIDGGAGRRFHRFRVVGTFSTIEGTAKALPVSWKHEIGGPGGATQIYVPPRFIGQPMHEDPEFRTFTYGDPTSPKAKLRELQKNDMLAFYAGPRWPCLASRHWPSETRQPLVPSTTS